MERLNQQIWNIYGLRHNPFDTNALSLEENAFLPITEAFVGRENSRENIFITNILRNPGGGRFVVEGDVGVGKTSFVNYHRALWEKAAEDKLLTPERELPIWRKWTVRDFLLNILSDLLERVGKLPGGDNCVKADRTLQEISLLCNIYRGESYNYGANVFGLGGSFGKEEAIHMPMVPETQLNRYFQYLVRKVKELGFAGVFLHLDNLELITHTHRNDAQLFFEDIRDTLQTRDVYFALVGCRGFFQDIIAPRERLKSIFFGRPIYVPPLTEAEVIHAIERRYELLKLPGTTFTQPFATDFIAYLYEIYRGKIRFIMEAVTTLIPCLSPHIPKTWSLPEAKSQLQEILREERLKDVTPQEWEVLKVAAEHEYFANREIAQALHMHASNVARALVNLESYQLIWQLRKMGRNVYYQVHEDVRVIIDQRLSHATVCQINQQSPGQKTQDKLSKTSQRAQKALKHFALQSRFTTKEYATFLEVSLGTARNDIKQLLTEGKVSQSGKTKKCCYVISK